MKRRQRKRALDSASVDRLERRVSICPGQPQELVLENISIKRAGKSLYRDFSMSMEASSSTALIAPSGEGKTSLLSFIAGLLKETDGECSGHVSFPGQEMDGKTMVSFLFQEPRLFPRCTVYENVLLPLLNLMGQDEASGTALRFLRECGLEGRLAAFPDELSGGERQRVALARAFAFPSTVMLLDEAFQNQDLAQKASLMDIYGRLLADSPKTVLFVTHDIREALACCSRVLVLKGSPVRVELDERLSACHGMPFSKLFLYPDEGRMNLERRIAGILAPERTLH